MRLSTENEVIKYSIVSMERRIKHEAIIVVDSTWSWRNNCSATGFDVATMVEGTYMGDISKRTIEQDDTWI